MHQSDHTGRSSTCGIFVDRSKGNSDRGATAAQPATWPSSYASTPGAIGRAVSVRTYSPRAGPVSSRLVLESSRWLRHQQTLADGFLGPSIVATSSNRAVVAGWISIGSCPRRPDGGGRRADLSLSA